MADPAAILSALPDPVIVIDGENAIAHANPAAEQFFHASLAALAGRRLDALLPSDGPVQGLVAQVRRAGQSVTQYGVAIESPRIGTHLVTLGVSGFRCPQDGEEAIVVSIHEHSMARKIDSQLTHRKAARSITAMSAMLAHEIKNPLSGIRGAAQLLEQGAEAPDRELTQLICGETDRIVALVDRMEMFSDDRPLVREAVNIHEVLDHVRRLALSGFAAHVSFKENYDPSLPAVFGNRDLLIQAFLNLVKNAAEAVPGLGGEIVLSTAYRQGMRLAAPGQDTRVELPLCIGLQDNGSGIPEDLKAHLFEAFVTGKPGGKGLGLALVAKVVGDHGGAIEIDSVPRRTKVRIMLPMAPSGSNGP